MSIANEIQRLQSAKADIKAAIEEKGVTVGEGRIDTYADLIRQITSGGGNLPNNIAAINGDTWTQVASLSSGVLEIEHGLTDTPDVIVITSDILELDAINSNVLAYMFYDNTSQSFGYSVCANKSITTRVNYNTANASSSQGITEVDSNKFVIKTAGNRQLAAGVTYSWVAISLTEGVEVDPSYEYNKGFEDGKNSVPQLDKGLKTATFTSLNIFGKKEVELNFDNITSLSNLFYINAQKNQNTIVEKLIINCPNQITSIMNMFYCNGTNWQDRTLKHITFNFDTQKCTAFSNAFNGAIALEIIDGQPLDCSSVTNASYFNLFVNTPKLIDCRFVSNSIKVNLNMSKLPDLSTDTIQSIIDGLATVDTTQTLTVHQTVRNKLTDEQLTTISNKNWAISPAEATQ